MAEDTAPSTSVSKRLADRFELLEQLSRGTLGLVYRANDTKTNRIVAVRTFDLPDWIEDPNACLQQILVQARSASGLSHPNIARLVGGGNKELKVYFAAEFIEGLTVRELLARKQFSLSEILAIAKQLLPALDYAHEKGLFHCMLNPCNLRLLGDGTLKITDFGVTPDRNIITPSPAKKLENEHYRSPEQVKNAPADRSSNLFVAAAILYELYTTRSPFAGKHIGEIDRNLTDLEPLPASKAHMRVPESISKVLAKGLSKNPQDRFQTGQAFLNALEGAALVQAPAVTAGGPRPAVKAPPADSAKPISNGQVAVPNVAKPAATGTSGAAKIAVRPPRKMPSFADLANLANFHLSRIEWKSAGPVVLIAACLIALSLVVFAPRRHAPVAQPAPAEEPVVQLPPEPSVPVVQAEEPAPQAQEEASPAFEFSEDRAGENPRKAARRARIQAAKLGTLAIASSPDGAQIQVDGSPIGPTPQSIAGMPMGAHTVTVSKPGYATETRTVNVNGGARASVTVRLAAVKGMLRVAGSPSGAAVYIDGRATGRVSPADFMLDPGQHSITLRKDGYLPAGSDVGIKVGEGLAYTPALKQLARTDTIKVAGGGIGGIKKMFGSGGGSEGMVRAQIKSRPKGADIIINGAVIGRATPVDLQLEPGNYEIVLQMLGYRPVHRIITAEAGQRVQIDEELQRY